MSIIFFFFNDTATPEIYTFPYTTLFRSVQDSTGGRPRKWWPARIRRWRGASLRPRSRRSEEHTSELQSLTNLVCRLLLEKKKKKPNIYYQLTTRTTKYQRLITKSNTVPR